MAIERARAYLAHAGVRYAPARQRVRHVGAGGDAEDVGQDAVAVVADREAPAAIPHQRTQVAAIAADRHRGDLHGGVPLAHALERVELAGAALAAGDEERQRDRATP